MGKVGGHRNFGYGKQMAWAGGQAIGDRYGQGHFGSAAAHTERWGQFAAWARANGVRDAREITTEVVTGFARELAEQVRQETMSVSYAQNLLSTVNVVMEAMRRDRVVRVSPSEFVGQRDHARTDSPAGLDREVVGRCVEALRAVGDDRVASVVQLARDLGLRAREASMLDARAALRHAEKQGAVNITAGTKGGRGNRVDRWVPVSTRAVETLRRAAEVQGPDRNLVPPALDWRQWNDRLHRVWADIRGEHGLAPGDGCRPPRAGEPHR